MRANRSFVDVTSVSLLQTPKFWQCEVVENWQPRKRKRRQAEACNLPWGKEAQAAWEVNPVGKGYV